MRPCEVPVDEAHEAARCSGARAVDVNRTANHPAEAEAEGIKAAGGTLACIRMHSLRRERARLCAFAARGEEQRTLCAISSRSSCSSSEMGGSCASSAAATSTCSAYARLSAAAAAAAASVRAPAASPPTSTASSAPQCQASASANTTCAPSTSARRPLSVLPHALASHVHVPLVALVFHTPRPLIPVQRSPSVLPRLLAALCFPALSSVPSRFERPIVSM